MSTKKTSNDYREERKARLAKASKQNHKKSHKISGPSISKGAKTVIYSVIAAVVVIAIAVGACYSFGVFERMKKIETVSGTSYSAVEYEYYYKSVYNYYYNMSAQYDSYYGSGYGYYYTGYDCSKLPAEQNYPYADFKNEDGSDATWQQFIEKMALESMQRNIALADMAEDAGFEMSAEAKSEAEENLQTLRDGIKEQAQSNGGQTISLGKYLRANYGKGMSEKLFLKLVERETLASEYLTSITDERAATFTDADLEKEYKKDTSAYDCVDFRMFTIEAETEDDATDAEKEKAKKDAKAKADKMFAAIKDEDSFIKLAEQNATDEQKESYDYSKSQTTLSQYITKSTIESAFGEDILEWLYNAKNEANTKKMFDVNGTYYIFYLLKPAYRDDSTLPVDVRHILYQIDSEAEDAKAEDAKQKAAAELALSKINEADDKLAKFLELVEESADTGSSSNGGLYEMVTKGQMVAEFENWCFDPSRTEGETAIVKTDYGYHVMYFVKQYTKPAWKITIANSMAEDQLEDEITEMLATDTYKVKDTAIIAEYNKKFYDNYVTALQASQSTAA